MVLALGIITEHQHWGVLRLWQWSKQESNLVKRNFHKRLREMR